MSVVIAAMVGPYKRLELGYRLDLLSFAGNIHCGLIVGWLQGPWWHITLKTWGWCWDTDKKVMDLMMRSYYQRKAMALRCHGDTIWLFSDVMVTKLCFVGSQTGSIWLEGAGILCLPPTPLGFVLTKSGSLLVLRLWYVHKPDGSHVSITTYYLHAHKTV